MPIDRRPENMRPIQVSLINRTHYKVPKNTKNKVPKKQSA